MNEFLFYAIVLAIAVFIGEVIGYKAGRESAEKLDQEHLLELKKYLADKEWAYIQAFGEDDNNA